MESLTGMMQTRNNIHTTTASSETSPQAGGRTKKEEEKEAAPSYVGVPFMGAYTPLPSA